MGPIPAIATYGGERWNNRKLRIENFRFEWKVKDCHLTKWVQRKEGAYRLREHLDGVLVTGEKRRRKKSLKSNTAFANCHLTKSKHWRGPAPHKRSLTQTPPLHFHGIKWERKKRWEVIALIKLWKRRPGWLERDGSRRLFVVTQFLLCKRSNFRSKKNVEL